MTDHVDVVLLGPTGVTGREVARHLARRAPALGLTWGVAGRDPARIEAALVDVAGRPDVVLRNVARALRPGGLFLMQEISGSGHVHKDIEHPLGPFLYTISCMHCMSVSLAGGGPGLGAMWGQDTALRMLRDAGFGDVRVEALPHDIMNFYYVARPSGS